MAGPFDEQLAVDAAAFVDPDFGMGAEPVTYTNRAGTTRAINAVIIRQSPENMRQGQPSIGQMAKVWVRNDSTYGISSAELNLGGDTLTFAMRRGGTAKAYFLHLPSEDQADQDGGMIQLEVRG